MKVYSEWLVKAYVFSSDTPRIAASFNTKKECIDRLNACFKKAGDNLWEDSLGQRFYIEKKHEGIQVEKSPEQSGQKEVD